MHLDPRGGSWKVDVPKVGEDAIAIGDTTIDPELVGPRQGGTVLNSLTRARGGVLLIPSRRILLEVQVPKLVHQADAHFVPAGEDPHELVG